VDEEDRRKRDEERRKNHAKEARSKEEEMRSREAELQKKRDDKRRREDDERKKVEDERRKERDSQDKERRTEAEKRRGEDEKRAEEAAKTKAEEDAKKQVEEEKRKEDEAKALKQQKATLAVLRVLQKLSNATPENFEALNTELESVMESELTDTGPQQEILKAEANRVREYAKQYVEQVRDQQKKLAEAEANAKAKQEESEKGAREVIEELNKLIAVAEEASEGSQYTCAPLAGEHSLEQAAVVRIASAVEQAGRLAMVACSNCADFLMSRKNVIDEAETIRGETTAALMSLQPRIQQATRQATEAMQRAATQKDKVARKVAASKFQEKIKTQQKHYDKDGDGVLDRKEVIIYAKAEFGFDLPEENLDRICRQLVKQGRKGVRLEDFQILKTAVGIAREEVRNKRKRVERIEREAREKEEAEKRQALVDAKMAELKEPTAELMTELDKLGPAVQASEAAAQDLTSAAGTLTTQDLKSKSEAIILACDPARKAWTDLREKTATLQKEVEAMPELGEILKTELSALTSRGDMYDMRLKTVEGIAANGRQLASHKAFAEKEALRMEVAARLRVAIEAQGGKPEDLFEQIAPDGKMDVNVIKAYLTKHQCEVELEKLEVVFAKEKKDDKKDEEKKDGDADDKSKPPIAKEDFMRVIRIFYKVIKEIVLSDNLLIEQSRQIRRMDVGEVMEVHQGPMLDPSVGVYRVHGKALKDGIVGWVTVAGNQGVTFLMPGGNVFQVTKPLPLTEELKDTDGANLVRELKEGQVLEVLEWARTSRSALGVTRIKAKLQGHDAIGWATISDNEGNAYLEAS